MDRWKESGGSKDLLEMFAQRIRTGIQYIRRNKVAANFICDQVSLNNMGLLQYVGRELKPYNVNWSNTLDYFKVSEFHAIGRVCSSEGDTIHTGYSMNWVADTHGASVMDMAKKSQKAFTGGSTRAYWVDEMARMRIDTHSLYNDADTKLAYRELVAYPPFADPEGIIGMLLIAKTGDPARGAGGLYNSWVDNFFALGRVAEVREVDGQDVVHTYDEGEALGGHQSWAITQHNWDLTHLWPQGEPLNPLLRISSSMSFIWTYDPNVVLNRGETAKLKSVSGVKSIV